MRSSENATLKVVLTITVLTLAGCQSASVSPLSRDAGEVSDTSSTHEDGAESDAYEADARTELDPPCAQPGALAECDVPGFPNRSMWVYIPETLDLSERVDLLVAFHGGGGSARTGLAITCPPNPGGRPDMTAETCLHELAEREGFVLVAPNGSDVGGTGRRTFNAGGGADGWQCVSAGACRAGIDEEAYLDAVLDYVSTWASVDARRTFLTGLSNGGALAHKLACTRSNRVAAIASVGAANQFATVEDCTPDEPVSILQVHGEGDPCWTYETTDTSCAEGFFAKKVGAVVSANAWAQRNGCDGSESLPPEDDVDGNGLPTQLTRWQDCDSAVELWSIEEHGHTWPDGFQDLPTDRIGPTDRDWSAARIWSWLADERN